MFKHLNQKQRETISGFFMNISVAWYVGLFVFTNLPSGFDNLNLLKYLANMVGAFLLGLYILKEEK